MTEYVITEEQKKKIEEILNNKKFDVLEAFDKYFDIKVLVSEVLGININIRYHYVDPIDGKIFFDCHPSRDMVEENNKLILGKIPLYIIKANKDYMLYVIYKNYDILNKLYLMRSNRDKTLMFDEILDTSTKLRPLVHCEAYYSKNGILENKINLDLVISNFPFCIYFLFVQGENKIRVHDIERDVIRGCDIERDVISFTNKDLEVAKTLGCYVTKITPKNIHWLASGKYILYHGIEEDMEEIDSKTNQLLNGLEQRKNR